jgi:hypothetical protein
MLTDNELSQLAGKREVLVDKIQEHYGIVKEETERQVENWASKLAVDGAKADIRHRHPLDLMKAAYRVFKQ